jgi:hypothetical protein
MEGNHRPDVKNALKNAAVQADSETSSSSASAHKLPVATAFGLQHLANHASRKSAADEAKLLDGTLFAMTSVYSKDDCRNGKNWAVHPYTLKISIGVYVCRQKRKSENSVLTRQDAIAAISIHNKILRGELQVQVVHFAVLTLLSLGVMSVVVCSGAYH